MLSALLPPSFLYYNPSDMSCRIPLFTFILVLISCSNTTLQETYDDYFAILEDNMIAKKQKVIDHFSSMSDTAQSISGDDLMVRAFQSFLTRPELVDYGEMEREVDRVYVSRYSEFYDILFISTNGFIFHSLRRESDYKNNLFTGELSNSLLSSRLRHPGSSYFTDYDYYGPSREAASFFIVPLKKHNTMRGWFVLQVAINNINIMLTDRSELGQSGEIYLINKNHMMLTESRFIRDSTVLKKQVDTVSVRKAFSIKSGRDIIDDYRGIKVLSTFENFKVMDSSWVIISEIDEGEVLTEHFKRDIDRNTIRICSYLESFKFRYSGVYSPGPEPIKVDMNEFHSAADGQVLQTFGVSTCTAISIMLPGQFTYLAHVPPSDDAYVSDGLTRQFLGDKRTSFVKDIFERIRYFDVCLRDLSRIRICISATHTDSISGILKILLDNDIRIDQIKFLYNPRARSANTYADGGDHSFVVEWTEKENGIIRRYCQTDREVPDLGTVFKIINK